MISKQNSGIILGCNQYEYTPDDAMNSRLQIPAIRLIWMQILNICILRSIYL
jgi:hypothetical protein